MDAVGRQTEGHHVLGRPVLDRPVLGGLVLGHRVLGHVVLRILVRPEVVLVSHPGLDIRRHPSLRSRNPD